MGSVFLPMLFGRVHALHVVCFWSRGRAGQLRATNKSCKIRATLTTTTSSGCIIGGSGVGSDRCSACTKRQVVL